MKTHCNIIKDLLPMYLENELSGESKKLVEEHLNECESCSQLMNELKQEDEFPVTYNSKKILKETSHRIIKTILRQGFVLLIIPVLWVLYFADFYSNRFGTGQYSGFFELTLVLIETLLICWLIFLIFVSITDRGFKENRIMLCVLTFFIIANYYMMFLPNELFSNEIMYHVPIQEIYGNYLEIYDGEEIVKIEMTDDFNTKQRLKENDGTRYYNMEWKELSLLDKRWLNEAREVDLSFEREAFKNRNVVAEQYVEGYMLSCLFGPFQQYRNQVNESIVEVHNTTNADIEYVKMIQEVDVDDLGNYVTYEIGNYEKNAHYTVVMNKYSKMIVGYKIY